MVVPYGSQYIISEFHNHAQNVRLRGSASLADRHSFTWLRRRSRLETSGLLVNRICVLKGEQDRYHQQMQFSRVRRRDEVEVESFQAYSFLALFLVFIVVVVVLLLLLLFLELVLVLVLVALFSSFFLGGWRGLLGFGLVIRVG